MGVPAPAVVGMSKATDKELQMAHFRGVVRGRAGEASRLGSKDSNLRMEAQSWDGKVVVTLVYDDEEDRDYALIELRPHNGEGVTRQLFYGPVGM